MAGCKLIPCPDCGGDCAWYGSTKPAPSRNAAWRECPTCAGEGYVEIELPESEVEEGDL